MNIYINYNQFSHKQLQMVKHFCLSILYTELKGFKQNSLENIFSKTKYIFSKAKQF